MDVSIIYVNWNSAVDIEASVASIRQSKPSREYEIIVVDNDSPLGADNLSSDVDIHLILNRENKGFGAGCNVGALRARGQYLLFLNPDTVLINDVIDHLAQFCDGHPSVGAVGPLIENEAGEPAFEGGRSLPSLFNDFLQHSTLSFRYPKGLVTSRPYLSRWDHKSTREVECILGACILIPAQAFRALGGFDESFFLYGEDFDLCRRLRKTGLSVWYVHTARLRHKERHSTLQLFGSVEHVILQNLKSQYLYFKKHYGASTAMAWRSMIALLYLMRYFANRNNASLAHVRWALGR